jgi:hemoglobin
MDVNDKEPLTSLHFNRWIDIFTATVDELYSGTKANEIKFKASNIKEVWEYKMNFINSNTY